MPGTARTTAPAASMRRREGTPDGPVGPIRLGRRGNAHDFVLVERALQRVAPHRPPVRVPPHERAVGVERDRVPEFRLLHGVRRAHRRRIVEDLGSGAHGAGRAVAPDGESRRDHDSRQSVHGFLSVFSL